MKNVLITNKCIKISDEDYKTKEFFLEKMNQKEKRLLDTRFSILYSSITKMIPFENDLGLQLFFIENEKQKKTYLELTSIDEYSEVQDFILSKTNLFKKEKTVRGIKSWIKQASYTLLAMIIGGITYFMAKSLEEGNTVNISGGRRRGVKKILLYIAENLGSINVLILFFIITIGLSYWTYSVSKNSKKIITIYST
ncbi:hypothetical protein [Aquimarina algiphila]|uniref:Uncharacterized protein n=1 Tax=Aquimarina algiphila TaxID=2047982 RepID=A0A554VCC6_9FLAO|nr:hypothetical protein [Aquimarina algiphila]TSE04325.1 hypothetical protein FOF46_26690 [Aquimarina algiphila]